MLENEKVETELTPGNSISLPRGLEVSRNQPAATGEALQRDAEFPMG